MTYTHVLRMRCSVCWLFALALSASCQRTPAPPSAEVLADARRELETRGVDDQRVREGFGAGGKLDTTQLRAMAHTDSANTSWLSGYVATWGWPTRAQVGADAVTAAFLIVQHAVHDTAFMHRMLPHIDSASRRGELKASDVAMLTDRLAVQAGRPQTYGTQLSRKDGVWVFDPIADSAHVDARRKAMGMPSLAEYRRLVDSVFK